MTAPADELAVFHEWFAERRRRHRHEVRRTDLARLDGWEVDPGTGAVAHRTGRFFSVQGLEIDTDHRDPGRWSQPVIVQPEIGILGIAVRVVDGRVHCLMQAKTEPGNVNQLQLSPTVQATRSNYSRVHGGRAVPYLEHFQVPRHGRWVYDALQSEQGSWFLAKRNRNLIVEVDEDLPLHDDFCWLSLDRIALLLREDNIVNMDARTVLAGLPFLLTGVLATGPGPRPRHTTAELLSWFTEAKSRHRLTRRLVPLAGLPDWEWRDGAIVHRSGRYFSVIGVDVVATGREVARWSQPLIAPCGRGVIGFLGRLIDGAFHVLVHAKTEAGTLDVVEMGPTVSCIPTNYGDDAPRPPYLEAFERAPADRVLVDVVQSEEGGRFHHAESRYMIVDIGDELGTDVPPDYCWMTLGQLTAFVRHGNHVNVAARCLLSCLAGDPATLPSSEPVGPR